MKVYKTIYINQDVWERARQSAEDNQRKYGAEIERLLDIGLNYDQKVFIHGKKVELSLDMQLIDFRRKISGEPLQAVEIPPEKLKELMEEE